MDTVSRWMPLASILLFLGVGAFWRSWLQRKRFGSWGVILFRDRRLGAIARDLSFVAILATEFGQAIVWAVSRESLAIGMLPLPVPSIGLVVAGIALVAAGMAFLVAAQLDLGVSWRIGIEEGARPGLVTTGFYRFSRNPIFLGMFVVLAGLTLLQPTWLSVGLLIVAVWCVRSQVLEEEIYLGCAYGEEYGLYAARVGRFVPLLGTLSR